VIGLLSWMPPTFSSEWSLILPGAGAGSAVNLESIGQASSTVSSPYTNSALDPRINYKAIAESPPVLAAAAKRVGMTERRFGRPRIKTVDQTALLHFRIGGPTPSAARDKARALYTALQEQLERLRDDEAARREAGMQRMLGGFGRKLQHTQQQILDYQSAAGLVSVDQFEELALAVEAMRRTRAELRAAQRGAARQVEHLAGALGVTAAQAADALLLRADPLFQRLLGDYAAPAAKLAELSLKLGPKHPELVQERDRRETARAALLERARQLVDEADMGTLGLLMLEPNDHRGDLFRELIAMAAKQAGMRSQIVELSNQITEMERRLEASTDDAATLADLQRTHQVATAVFTTALARQDIGKADLFASYPLVQLLAEPTLPERPDSLYLRLALAGGALASLLVTVGLALLWIRKPYLRRILKNA
jgi:uncharacterized protein involved in exopolysaccharide biosynthesis